MKCEPSWGAGFRVPTVALLASCRLTKAENRDVPMIAKWRLMFDSLDSRETAKSRA